MKQSSRRRHSHEEVDSRFVFIFILFLQCMFLTLLTPQTDVSSAGLLQQLEKRKRKMLIWSTDGCNLYFVYISLALFEGTCP